MQMTLSSDMAIHISEVKSPSSRCVNCHTSLLQAQSAVLNSPVTHHVRYTN